MKLNSIIFKLVSVFLIFSVSLVFIPKVQAGSLFDAFLGSLMLVIDPTGTLLILDAFTCTINIIWGGCGGGGGGGASAAVSVDVRANGNPTEVAAMQAKTIDWRVLTASDLKNITLTAPANFAIKWSSANASKCKGNFAGQPLDPVANSGVQIYSVNTGGSFPYTVSCGGVSDTATVNVIGPKLVFTTPSPVVEIPDPVILNWDATGVSTCVAAGDWSGNKPVGVGQSEAVISPTDTASRGIHGYAMTCFDNFGNSVNGDLNVNVIQVPRCTFSHNPNSVIFPPAISTLSWTCVNANKCSLDQGIGQVCNSILGCASGSKKVRPSITTTYNLTCNGLDGERTYSTTVDVGAKGGVIEINPHQ